MTRDEIIRDLSERSAGAGAGQYMSLRCDVAREIVDLLKEQEPRVMTREEVIDLLQGAVVWYEERAESGTYLRAMISTGNGFLGDFYLGVNAHDVELKRQRFWTSRPTPEQMRNTPWEGAENADMR